MKQIEGLSDHVFLSPHFDDICFSLGGYLAQFPRSILINIFTKCNFIANPELKKNFSQNVNSIEAISRLRDLEDEKFSKNYSLNRINLDLAEATVIGKHPFDLSRLEEEVEEVNHILMMTLTEITPSKASEKMTLYCPMGIGGHRNHLSVLLSILQNYNRLLKKFKIVFYEDLPYAANPLVREAGILQFKSYFRDISFKRYKKNLTDLNVQHKLQALELYQSQQHPGVVAQCINAYSENIIRTESLWEACLKG